MIKSLTCIALSLLLAACHSPERFSTAVKTGGSVTTKEGTLYEINGANQICNQSATQDPVRYPACLMFLDIQGRQAFRVDQTVTPGMDSTTVYLQHDHIFMVDTANLLRWYFARSALSAVAADKIQDPEWSADGAYAVFLFGQTEPWDGYTVRLTDKQTFHYFTSNSTQGLIEKSDPHLWVGETAEDTLTTPLGRPDTRFATRTDAMTYFGSKNVKFVHVNYDALASANVLYFADYHQGQTYPDTFSFAKPAGRADWGVENPIISPDGEWVAYTLVSSSGQDFETYLQQLVIGSEPIFIATGSDPHFWVREDGTAYLLWSTRGGNAQEAYETITVNSIGQTLLQEVRLYATGPLSLRFRKVGDPIVAVPYPMKGGISRDGGFVVTGYNRAYIWAIK